MKNHIIISLLFLSVGLSQQEYNSNDIVEMDNGLWTEKFSDEPISGKVYGYFGKESNPKKVYIGNMVNGKKEGRWKSYYHSTGKKKYDENYKDGKLGELRTEWYENGNIKSITSHKETRNRIEIVKYVNYYSNGQKKSEITIKEGKKDGVSKSWYENGQKEYEKTYKNGNLISKKEWNEDGSVKE